MAWTPPGATTGSPLRAAGFGLFAILAVLMPALLVMGYLDWSWATTGLLAPISGAANGEGALIQNV